MQMKMFLTRLDEDSHMIIAGDTRQIDLSKNQVSSLIEDDNQSESFRHRLHKI